MQSCFLQYLYWRYQGEIFDYSYIVVHKMGQSVVKLILAILLQFNKFYSIVYTVMVGALILEKRNKFRYRSDIQRHLVIYVYCKYRLSVCWILYIYRVHIGYVWLAMHYTCSIPNFFKSYLLTSRFELRTLNVPGPCSTIIGSIQFVGWFWNTLDSKVAEYQLWKKEFQNLERQ